MGSASISEVVFAMNHSSGHRMTCGYIKLDFTPAWVLNEKVVDFIFFTDSLRTNRRCASVRRRSNGR